LSFRAVFWCAFLKDMVHSACRLNFLVKGENLTGQREDSTH